MTSPRQLTANLSVAPQITAADLPGIAAAGFRSILCNRPDGEGADQPGVQEITRAAQACGLEVRYQPIISGKVQDDQAIEFGRLIESLPGPVLAYCRTGTRSATLWALSQAGRLPLPEVIDRAAAAGYDLKAVARRILQGGRNPAVQADLRHAVVIVGGGAAGIAVASSLLARQPGLDIALIDPADIHYYQPGWTLVGGGIFQADSTARTLSSVLPRGVRWIKAAVAAFEPDQDAILLDGCQVVRYEQLIVCPGLKLDWDAIDGLSATLGHNGVTSNYRFDLAPYTWQCVQKLAAQGGGHAVFSQPPMPIKCAGAPQKAMYLSADAWRLAGMLEKVDIRFCNAGTALFGVAEYVPALMEYVARYAIHLQFGENLIAVDGPGKRATFRKTGAGGETEEIERPFDMLHVVPPQRAPDFIRVSPLADAAGWIDLDQQSLRHKKYPNIFALGDAGNTPNAKTAAAARKQAPVVAHNVLQLRSGGGDESMARYDGYGSCPLTVERGRVVLAEFTYGGKVAPSFPGWFIDGTRPSRLAWWLKERAMPPLYWQAMLKGREWLARPNIRS